MRIVRTGSGLQLIGRFARMSEALASDRGRTEMNRGVIDAGRKVKTLVQRAVSHQMALNPGTYQSYVVGGTRGIPRQQILAFDIFGVKGGTDAASYKGLRAVSAGNTLNKGRKGFERGTVKSSMWNQPRIFKRSFATAKGDFYAVRPASEGTTSTAPRIFWTFGKKADQPRGPRGRFAKSGQKYGKIRRLYGPSLMMEIPEDESLETFMAQGPQILAVSVERRLVKLMRF